MQKWIFVFPTRAVIMWRSHNNILMTETILFSFISLLAGYLIGSISPGYLFGRILKKIDIRQHGLGNTGATNTFRVVGKVPGVVTVIFDLAKGILAIFISYYFLEVPLLIAYLSGLMAVVGHIFPFYLQFRGGHGIATCMGQVIFFIVRGFQNQWISWQTVLIPIIAGAIFFFITRKKVERRGAIPFLIAMPSLLVFLYLPGFFNQDILFLTLLVVYPIIYYIFREDKKRSLLFKSAKQIKDLRSWRTILRPLAVLFPILYFYYDKKVLYLTFSLCLIFILVDLFRFGFKLVDKMLLETSIIKEKEKGVFSSMSFFMVAVSIAFLIFNKPIAILAVTFLIFGDLFSKVFGLIFGRTRFFQKTLEGAGAYFAACLISGYIFAYFLNFPFSILFVGALVAAITESLPIGIDDNFTVALISGAAMYLMTII